MCVCVHVGEGEGTGTGRGWPVLGHYWTIKALKHTPGGTELAERPAPARQTGEHFLFLSIPGPVKFIRGVCVWMQINMCWYLLCGSKLSEYIFLCRQ